MELARPLAAEPPAQTSPLTTLRLQRKLTVEEAAKRASLWPEQVEWLEEGQLYRFPRHDTAVLALLRYATALGIDHREARRRRAGRSAGGSRQGLLWRSSLPQPSCSRSVRAAAARRPPSGSPRPSRR